MSKPRKAFAERVHALRVARGLSQEKLAELAGLSRDAVARIERDERAPRIGTLESIAAALDIDLGALVSGSGAKPTVTPEPAVAIRMRSIMRSLERMEPWAADVAVDVVRLLAQAHSKAQRSSALLRAADPAAKYGVKRRGRR